MILDFLVRKDHLATTQVRSKPVSPLNRGEIRLRIDKFALTSNNITYAAFGEANLKSSHEPWNKGKLVWPRGCKLNLLCWGGTWSAEKAPFDHGDH